MHTYGSIYRVQNVRALFDRLSENIALNKKLNRTDQEAQLDRLTGSQSMFIWQIFVLSHHNNNTEYAFAYEVKTIFQK